MENLKYAVICVDDDQHILQMLSFQLQKIVDSNCTLVEYFTNPIEALNNIDELKIEEIDVIFVIVDFQMPEMNGAQLIRKIKNQFPNLSCVMLSGQANDRLVQELKQENLLFEFIAKPWNEDKLFSVIRPIIEKYNR